MPFTLQAERSADRLAVRWANRPTDPFAGFPAVQSAGQPEDRQTDKQAQRTDSGRDGKATGKAVRRPDRKPVINN